MIQFIDTHTHLDGTEFDADRDEVMERARAAGVSKVFLPAIDLKSVETVLAVSRKYEGYAYPMIGCVRASGGVVGGDTPAADDTLP